MKVKFHRTWFAPTANVEVDKIRVRSGARYSAGVHTLPDHLFEYLPSLVEIIEPPLDKRPVKPVQVDKAVKADPSAESRAMDQVQEAHYAADAKSAENRKKILAKARAAKAAKRKENKMAADKKPTSAKMEAHE